MRPRGLAPRGSGGRPSELERCRAPRSREARCSGGGLCHSGDVDKGGMWRGKCGADWECGSRRAAAGGPAPLGASHRGHAAPRRHCRNHSSSRRCRFSKSSRSRCCRASSCLRNSSGSSGSSGSCVWSEVRAAKNWLRERLRPQSTRLAPRTLSALPTGIARGALRRCSGGELQGELQGGDAVGLRPAQRSQPSLGLRDDRLRALASVGGSRESKKRRGVSWGDMVPTQAFFCSGRSVCTSASRTCTRTFQASLAGASDSREACDSEETSPPESEERK